MEQTDDIFISDGDLETLINEIFSAHGHDFSEYSRASFKRRIQRLLLIDRFSSFAEFRYRLVNDEHYFQHAVEEISVQVTEMLRDPGFYKTIRTQIIPTLATNPYIKIWHAGCSTGEEVYSMAILLKEANLLHKSIIYGTDINGASLEKATKGIFPLGSMQQYSRNYQQSGGQEDFSSYYTANYHFARFDPELSKQMVFSTHNLVTDFSFNSFQLIFCRNVMIYFNKNLQNRVLKIFDESLDLNGYLALGTKESIRFSTIATKYKPVIGREKIWRKLQ